MNPWSVLLKPLVTEKSMKLQQKQIYTFVVDRSANKDEIRRAVEAVYADKKIKVTDVRTLRMKGKYKRMKNMLLEGRRRDWKKAFVRIAEGQRLDII